MKSSTSGLGNIPWKRWSFLKAFITFLKPLELPPARPVPYALRRDVINGRSKPKKLNTSQRQLASVRERAQCSFASDKSRQNMTRAPGYLHNRAVFFVFFLVWPRCFLKTFTFTYFQFQFKPLRVFKTTMHCARSRTVANYRCDVSFERPLITSCPSAR